MQHSRPRNMSSSLFRMIPLRRSATTVAEKSLRAENLAGLACGGQPPILQHALKGEFQMVVHLVLSGSCG